METEKKSARLSSGSHHSKHPSLHYHHHHYPLRSSSPSSRASSVASSSRRSSLHYEDFEPTSTGPPYQLGSETEPEAESIHSTAGKKGKIHKLAKKLNPKKLFGLKTNSSSGKKKNKKNKEEILYDLENTFSHSSPCLAKPDSMELDPVVLEEKLFSSVTELSQQEKKFLIIHQSSLNELKQYDHHQQQKTLSIPTEHLPPHVYLQIQKKSAGPVLQHAKTIDTPYSASALKKKSTKKQPSLDKIKEQPQPQQRPKTQSFQHIPLERFSTIEPQHGAFQSSLSYRMQNTQMQQPHMTIHAFDRGDGLLSKLGMDHLLPQQQQQQQEQQSQKFRLLDFAPKPTFSKQKSKQNIQQNNSSSDEGEENSQSTQTAPPNFFTTLKQGSESPKSPLKPRPGSSASGSNNNLLNLFQPMSPTRKEGQEEKKSPFQLLRRVSNASFKN